MSEKEITELVEEAKAPGTFSIIDAINNRAYPKDEVVIYLDEQTAYDAAIIDEKIKELGKSASMENQDEIDSLIGKRDALIEKLEAGKYTFILRGISEGLREDLMEQAAKEYPIEYNEIKNPITGEFSRNEIENKNRDRLFTNLLWHEHIEKIINSDGSEQNKISLDDVVKLRRNLPIAAIGELTQSIEKLRVSTAMFMMSVNEDFLAKS